MQRCCFYARIERKVISPIRDEKDLYLLALADTVQADYILTGDKDLLVLKKHNKTCILTYVEFCQLLGRKDLS